MKDYRYIEMNRVKESIYLVILVLVYHCWIKNNSIARLQSIKFLHLACWLVNSVSKLFTRLLISYWYRGILPVHHHSSPTAVHSPDLKNSNLIPVLLSICCMDYCMFCKQTIIYIIDIAYPIACKCFFIYG